MIDKNKTLHYLSHSENIHCFIFGIKSKPASRPHAPPAEPLQSKIKRRGPTLPSMARYPDAIKSTDNAPDTLAMPCTRGKKVGVLLFNKDKEIFIGKLFPQMKCRIKRPNHCPHDPGSIYVLSSGTKH